MSAPLLRTLGILLVAASSLSAVACRPKGKDDAALLVTTVGRWRSADDGREELGRRIAGVPAAVPDVRAAREACVAAAEGDAKAVAARRAVKEGLDRIARGELAKTSPEALALPTKLAEAEELLTASQGALDGCVRAVDGLKQTYDVR